MKKLTLVGFIIVCVLVSTLPAMAGGLLNRRTAQSIGIGIITNRIIQAENDRKRRRNEADRNSNDLKRNRNQIRMQAERDAYQRQKKLDELRFQRELDRERELQRQEKKNGYRDTNPENQAGVIVLRDPWGRYRLEDSNRVFETFEALNKYAKQMFPGKKIMIFIQEVDHL